MRNRNPELVVRLVHFNLGKDGELGEVEAVVGDLVF